MTHTPRPSLPLWALILPLIVVDVAELLLWLRQWRLADYETSLSFAMYALPIFVAQLTLCAVGFSRSDGSVRKFFMYHGIISALIFACARFGLLAP